MSPVSVIVFRYAMGAVILLGAAIWHRAIREFRRSDLKGMVILALVGIVLQQFLQVTGQVTANASVAAFLASTAPAFMVILSAWWLKEVVSGWQIVGVLIATIGAAVVAVGGDWGSLMEGDLIHLGNILVLLSAVAWAIYTILTRKLVADRPPILIAGGMLFFGWLFSMPVWIYQRGWQEIPDIGVNAWLALICVGVFSTAITYLLYSHALKLAPASRLSAIQNIEPLVATIAAVWILGESITSSLLLGGFAIFVGVYLAETRAKISKDFDDSEKSWV
jgi:drug/metabolite transporter (DMT)-like permease